MTGKPVVLVVEDDDAQRRALATMLTAHGYHVEVASDGARALTTLVHVEPDVVLLDLGLPDIDGLELCRRLRVWLHCPIVVVTADAVEDRMVEALDLGADDYVLKPYSSRVLLARLRVAVRHRASLRTVVDDQVLECGDVRIDTAARQVRVAGEVIELQARQFALLSALVRNAGKVVTNAVLAKALGGTGPAVDLSGVRMAVTRARKLLGDGPDRPVIVTEPRVGYRLVGPDDRELE